MSHRYAAFPWNADWGGGHALLGGNVVFVFAAHGAVGSQQPRLNLAGFLHHLAQADILTVLGRNLSAIQPEHVNAAVVLHQLHDLAMGELDILFPQLRLLCWVVGGIAPVTHGQFLPFGPVPGAVPVRLGKISGNGDGFFAKSVEHAFGDVGMLVRVEGAVRRGNLVIGQLCVEHAEAVVVLGGKNQVFEAVARGHFRPLFRLNAHGVETFVQADVLLAENGLVLFPADGLARPFGILVAQRPRFADAQLGIQTKVHHQRQLLILKPFQPLLNERILRTHIFILTAAPMHALFDQICHVLLPPFEVLCSIIA